tara:strand:- start:17539 stop:17730 length:192 start_codon:yes stop_codon:yes gene_type:complete
MGHPRAPKVVSKKRSNLTAKEKAQMRKHAQAHTKRHMALMTNLMKDGMSMGAAHKAAMKKVGK